MISADKWEFYQDSHGYWHWKRIDPNGRTISASKKDYFRQTDCIDSAVRNGYTGNEFSTTTINK